MAIKVHPGIGVARIGNSPEYFIGPEVPDAASAPAGGFRDAECRIKRQAAVFRVFEHLANGTVSEITASPTTTITWTVNLSKTLVFAGPDVSIAGPGLAASVPGLPAGTTLAELQTDAGGRLLVCSGNTAISHVSGIDGRCEGYVRASVVRDGVALAAIASSWVVIYPPDFAPALDPSSGGAAGSLLPLWPGAPPTSSALSYTDQLDRGPLTFVGGWDGSVPGSLSDFQEPFRFGEAGAPSSLLHPGYDNWAADLYYGCSLLGWVAGVAVGSGPNPPSSAKGANWRLRGFLAEQPDTSLEYVDWCPEVVAPAQVNFYQVPRGTERAVPINLKLKNFPEITTVISTVVGQPAVHLASATWDTPVVTENGPVPVTVWAFFQAAPDAALGVATGTIEFQFDSRHTVSIPLQAEVVEATQVAVSLVLDCSGSMAASRGDGLSRLEGLKGAVNVFLDVAQPGNGVAVAPFSTTALTPQSAQILGNGGATDEAPGGARRHVRDFVGALATDDLTAIGAGILSGQGLINAAPVAAFDRKAIIVVTDGYETAAPYITDVTDSITANMYAIGIGPAFEPALREIVGARGGLVTIVSDPVAPGNRYALEKYFLQVLAGVTAGDIVVDPEGELSPGDAHRIPFVVSEAEMRIDITVVSDNAPGLLIAVEGPSGKIRTLEQIVASGRGRVTRTPRVGHVELWLPFDPGQGDDAWGPGAWAIWVAHPGKNFVSSASQLEAHVGPDAKNYRLPGSPSRGRATYLAMATTASALHMNPSMLRVDDGVILEASLSYGGAPVLRNPGIFAELTIPSRMTFTVPLIEAGPGLFQARVSSAKLGRYLAIFRAQGTSPLGHSFQRERTIEEFFEEDRPRRSASSCCSGCSCRRPGCSGTWPHCKLPPGLVRLEEKLHEAFHRLEQRCRR